MFGLLLQRLRSNSPRTVGARGAVVSTGPEVKTPGNGVERAWTNWLLGGAIRHGPPETRVGSPRTGVCRGIARKTGES